MESSVDRGHGPRTVEYRHCLSSSRRQSCRWAVLTPGCRHEGWDSPPGYRYGTPTTHLPHGFSGSPCARRVCTSRNRYSSSLTRVSGDRIYWGTGSYLVLTGLLSTSNGEGFPSSRNRKTNRTGQCNPLLSLTVLWDSRRPRMKPDSLPSGSDLVVLRVVLPEPKTPSSTKYDTPERGPPPVSWSS